MSWLLSEAEFELASQAMRSGDVTPALYAFLRRVVSALARGGALAPALSPTGRWDEGAIDEALQGWLSEKLLPGGLARAFQVTNSSRTLSRYLEQALRNWLVSQTRTRGHPRLLSRARHLLEEGTAYHKFVDASSAQDRWWGLAGWTSPSPYQGPDDELVRAAYAVPDIALLRYTAASKRADPVISNADLDRLLTNMLQAIGRLLTLRHFHAALRGRFAYAYHGTEEPLELIEEPADVVTALETIEIEATAREVLLELTGRQVAILRDRINEQLTLDQLATQHAVSRGTVDNELKRAASVIRVHLLDDSHLSAVLEKVFEFAFEATGGDQ